MPRVHRRGGGMRLRPRRNVPPEPEPEQHDAQVRDEPAPNEAAPENRPRRRGNRRRAPAPRQEQHAEQAEQAEPAAQNEANQQNVAPPPPKQPRTTDVPAANGNILNNLHPDPILMPCANETDIIVSQQMKEKIWNFEYVDFAQLIRQNSQFYNNTDQKQNIAVENGILVVSTKPSKLRTVDNIDVWTEAFSHYSKILIQKHALLAQDLFTYMSVIRGAIVDAPFERVHQYDRQFRLRVSQNHTKSFAQIDGFLWLQFIAKGAQGTVVTANSSKPCYDYNFKGFCQKSHCIYRHNCVKCSLLHPAIACVRFDRVYDYQLIGNRPRFNNYGLRPPMVGQNRPLWFNQNRPQFFQQNRPALRLRHSVPRFQY